MSAHAGRRVVAPLVVQQRPVVVPLSFAQSRLWFIEQLQGPSSVYNMPVALRLRGMWMWRRWGGAGRCGGRHESLRTIFVATEGIPQQVVLPVEQVESGLGGCRCRRLAAGSPAQAVAAGGGSPV